MGRRRIAAIAFAALPAAVALTLAVGSTASLAGGVLSDEPGVGILRGIAEQRPGEPAAKRTLRGRVVDRDVPETAVPWSRFGVGPGPRVPYPYWPSWRQTLIPTHCAPRWMC